MLKEILCAWCGEHLDGGFRAKEGIVCHTCAQMLCLVEAGSLSVSEGWYRGDQVLISPPVVLTLKMDYWEHPNEHCIWGIAQDEHYADWFDQDGYYGDQRRRFIGVTGRTVHDLAERVAESLLSTKRFYEHWIANDNVYDPTNPENIAKTAEYIAKRATFDQRVRIIPSRFQ